MYSEHFSGVLDLLPTRFKILTRAIKGEQKGDDVWLCDQYHDVAEQQYEASEQACRKEGRLVARPSASLPPTRQGNQAARQPGSKEARQHSSRETI